MDKTFFDQLNDKLVETGLMPPRGGMAEKFSVVGHVDWRLLDENGRVKQEGQRCNLVTSVGDMFLAQFLAYAAVGSVAYATLGVSTIAPLKAHTDVLSAIATTSRGISGGYPQRVNSFGTGAGEWCVWRYEWAAGAATNGSIGEIGIWTSASSFVARALVDPVVSKTANDTLQVDHGWKFLGA